MMGFPSPLTFPRQRALVVEPDEVLRLQVTELLRERGLEVIACADVEEGRDLFADHRLVVAPLNGDNSAMKEFVAWVRAEAGISQPWIIALGEDHELAPGETPAHYGVNDLLTGPIDSAALTRRLEELGLELPQPLAAAQRLPHAAVVSPFKARHLPGTGTGPGTGSIPTGTDVDPPGFACPPSYQRGPVRGNGETPFDRPFFPALLLDQIPAAVAVLDRKLRYVAVNARWVDEFQIPALPMPGRPHTEVFPDLHPAWLGLYRDCLASGISQISDDLILRPDGAEVPVRWEIQPWKDAGGSISGLFLICTTADPVPARGSSDSHSTTGGISSLRKSVAAEEHAEPAELLSGDFREMAEAAPFGMIVLDDEAHVIYANPQVHQVLGHPIPAGHPLEGWLERTFAGDGLFRARALEEWWENVWRRRTNLTCTLRHSDGAVKEIEFRPANLTGDRLLLTVVNVTDARMEEQAVRSSEARYRGLFQDSSAALMLINPAGNLTEINPAFELLSGLPRHEARRASLSSFLNADAIQRLQAASQEQGPSHPFVTSFAHLNGMATQVHAHISVIRNEQDQPVFTACLLVPLPSGEPEVLWQEITPDWLFVLDGEGTVLEHTQSRDFALWQSPDAPALLREPLEAALPALTAPLPLDVMMERLLDQPGHETRCEYTVGFPGEITPRRIEARLILLPGNPHRFGLNLRDVTRARPAVRSGSFHASLLEQAATPAVLTNERGRIQYLNPAAEILCGYASSELADQGLYRLFRPEDPQAFGAELSGRLQQEKRWITRTTFRHKTELQVHCDVELTPVYEESTGFHGFVLLIRPVSSHPSTESAAPVSGGKPANAAKPAAAISLHRARNDLQILTSLMTLQSEHPSAHPARSALTSCRDRLAAVGMIYRMVQHEEDLVDLRKFIHELGRILMESRNRPAGSIILETLFPETLLPQRLAVQLGLIIGELLASSLQSSFPDPASSGRITLTLTAGQSEGLLILRDNGQSMDAATREGSFSCELIHLLAAQIGGSITWIPDPDNQVYLRFRIPS